jgi:hypothetical protein
MAVRRGQEKGAEFLLLQLMGRGLYFDSDSDSDFDPDLPPTSDDRRLLSVI